MCVLEFMIVGITRASSVLDQLLLRHPRVDLVVPPTEPRAKLVL